MNSRLWAKSWKNDQRGPPPAHVFLPVYLDCDCDDEG